MLKSSISRSLHLIVPLALIDAVVVAATLRAGPIVYVLLLQTGPVLPTVKTPPDRPPVVMFPSVVVSGLDAI